MQRHFYDDDLSSANIIINIIIISVISVDKLSNHEDLKIVVDFFVTIIIILKE